MILGVGGGKEKERTTAGAASPFGEAAHLIVINLFENDAVPPI